MKISTIVIFVAGAGLALAQANRDSTIVKNPLADRSDAVEAGQKRFREACAGCHGATAEGGRGPNLAENDDLRRMSDHQLFNTIRNGIRGSDMPAFPLPDTLTWEIVSFVRSLSTPAFLSNVSGNVDAGRALFTGKGNCERCHMIRGVGGFLGPDLTDVASLLTTQQLRQSILEPNSRMPERFIGVIAVDKGGHRIQGVAKNNSNYSIQILDEAGKLHLLNKSDLQQLDFQSKSLMPDTYKQSLSSQEIQDLVAFLSRQALRPDAHLGRERPSPEER